MLKPLDQTLTVAIVISPDFTLADIVGAHTVFGFSPNVEVHMVWKSTDAVNARPHWPVMPTLTFDECPQVDVVVIGAVTPEVTGDSDVIAFLQRQDEGAAAMIGICGGVLVFAAAGLLKGRRATASLAYVDILTDFGVTRMDPGEVIIDGKYYTAGPVMGSFEASLKCLAALRGEEIARFLELAIEYDPKPPFGVGRRDLAGPELTATVLSHFEQETSACLANARRAYQEN